MSSYRTYEEWKPLQYFISISWFYSSYRTYEEWKLGSLVNLIMLFILFLPYLWGMETTSAQLP